MEENEKIRKAKVKSELVNVIYALRDFFPLNPVQEKEL